MEYDVVEEWGVIVFFKKGTKMFHRKDGPAYVSSDGYEAWYFEGKRHREDGPAITYSTGEEFYYLNHERLTKEEFVARVG